jgi:hypothetical protein
VGASVEATVGAVAQAMPAWWPTALAVSRVVPPPTPTTTSALAFLATSVIRSISRWEQTPPKTSRVNSTPASLNDAESWSLVSFHTFSSSTSSGCWPSSATCLLRAGGGPSMFA